MNIAYQWFPLSTCEDQFRESEVQHIFERWDTDRAGWLVGGTPTWLRGKPNPEFRRRFSVRNYDRYSFIPDVVLEGADADYVLELKRTPKGEELALTEALHQAWFLNQETVRGREVTKPVVPVTVTACSAWLRAALSYLFAHGLRKEALRQLEVTMLTEADGRRLLWLEDPHASWSPGEPPPCLPRPWLDRGLVSRVTGSECWVLHPDPRPKVMPFVPARFAMFLRTEGVDEWLAYLRADPDSSGQYFRIAPTATLPGNEPPCPC